MKILIITILAYFSAKINSKLIKIKWKVILHQKDPIIALKN